MKSVLRGVSTLMLAVCLVTLVTIPASAAFFTYILDNHPDGSLSGHGGLYGIRVDALDPPPGNGPSFSMDPTDVRGAGIVDVRMDIDTDAKTAKIYGTVRHNFDLDIWNVNYEMSDIDVVDASKGYFTLSQPNTGLGELSNSTTTFDLLGKANGSGIIFAFLGDGHRLSGDNSSPVGRGWFKGDRTNDFLFTATAVPIPAALPLLGSAIAGLAITGWRRRKSA